MNFISILLLIVLGIAIIATVGGIFIFIIKNFLAGQDFRVPYAEKISQLRFGRMLVKHAVSSQELLHRHQISEIEAQISTCSSCVKTSECDRILNKTVVSEHELEFCQNHAFIAQLKYIHS